MIAAKTLSFKQRLSSNRMAVRTTALSTIFYSSGALSKCRTTIVSLGFNICKHSQPTRYISNCLRKLKSQPNIRPKPDLPLLTIRNSDINLVIQAERLSMYLLGLRSASSCTLYQCYLIASHTSLSQLSLQSVDPRVSASRRLGVERESITKNSTYVRRVGH